MYGLARTTPDPRSTFVLMGGDICHFAGDFRPTLSYPLPNHIPSGILDSDTTCFPIPCPCSLFTDQHPVLLPSPSAQLANADTTPFYKVSTHPKSAYIDPPIAQESVNQLTNFDASPSVLVCIAHDGALLQFLPTLNDDPKSDLNDWKLHGWKEKCHWGWLNELPRLSRAGRKPIVEGFWRDGKPWNRAESEFHRREEVAGGTGL